MQQRLFLSKSWLPQAICASTFNQNKTMKEGNFLWINHGTDNLPVTAGSKRTEAAVLGQNLLQLHFGAVAGKEQSAYLSSKLQSFQNQTKPNCLLQMGKITGKSKVQHAENRDSHVCEPCQDGLIFFLCTFILKKINPICFIKNFFSWLWKQKIKNACF